MDLTNLSLETLFYWNWKKIYEKKKTEIISRTFFSGVMKEI